MQFPNYYNYIKFSIMLSQSY